MDGVGAGGAARGVYAPVAGPSRTPPRQQRPPSAFEAASSSSPSPSSSTSPSRKRRKIDLKGKGKASLFGSDMTEDGSDDDDLPPVIVALDVDCFYAQACRIRDPTLNGLPLGVQQKTILAAVSYEARALGVPKIVSMREALRILPTLTIVNGEDLSYFRLLSNRNWRLLRALVWDERVEKCGMDELWADVTDTVDDHLLRCKLGTVNRNEGAGIFFSFDRAPLDEIQPVDTSRGFWYRTTDPIPGHFRPANHTFADGWPPDPWLQRYALGTHIAVFFRRIIKERVNLACSGGISFSKQMSKLCCSENKPDKQTCFCPARSASDSSRSVRDFKRHFLNEAQAFIDPMDLGKLNGFGHVYVKKLEEIYQSQNPSSTQTQADRPSDFDWLYGHSDASKAKHRLTVGVARKLFSAQQFDTMFGTTIGPRLWDILNANDTEPVAIASDFPNSISIEDTYRNLKGHPVVIEMRKLSESLIKRLEVECVDLPDEAWLARTQRPVLETIIVPNDDAGPASRRDEPVLTQVRTYVDVGDEDESSTVHSPSNENENLAKVCDFSLAGKPRTWKRYPLSVRLSLRIGWGARFSRTGRMPVGVFDLKQPRKERAQVLLGTVQTLFRQMTASRDITEGFNLINIAALELSKSPPAANDIKNMLAKASNLEVDRLNGAPSEGEVASALGHAPAAARVPPPIDVDMLKELPADIAAEIAQEYGIQWPPADSAPMPAALPSPPPPSPGRECSRSRTPSLKVARSPSPAPLSSSPSWSSFPPSQLSVQSFSPPPPSTPATPSPASARDDEHGIDGDDAAAAVAKKPESRSGGDEQEGTGDATAAVTAAASKVDNRKFGHFELSGQEISADDFLHFLAPPSPPLFSSPPPERASPEAGSTTEDAKAVVADVTVEDALQPVSPAHSQRAKEGVAHPASDWQERQCGRCGRSMLLWLQHDHDLFGESGLPPGVGTLQWTRQDAELH